MSEDEVQDVQKHIYEIVISAYMRGRYDGAISGEPTLCVDALKRTVLNILEERGWKFSPRKRRAAGRAE